MWKKFKNIILILVIFIVLDIIIGRILAWGYRNAKFGDIADVNYGVFKCDEEVLFMGASEISRSVVSNLVSDSLEKRCFNLARDGNNIYYQYFILESLLSRYKPELVIISTTVLEESERSINNILPYMSNNIFAKNIILEIAPIEYYKSLLNVYRYNSLVDKIIQGNINQSNDSFNGYKPLYQRNNVNKNFNYSNKPYKIGLSKRTMQYYGRFLDLCNRKNVPVLVLNMPKFALHSDLKEEFAIKRLIKNYNCKYLDYSKDTAIVNRKDFFKDVSHLNNDGAIYFSKKLSHDILRIYNVK